MTSDVMKMFEEEIERETVFEDVSKASPDYVPERLVHRREEEEKLRDVLEPLLNGGPRGVLITGPVGVGKTAMTSKMGRELERKAGEEGPPLVYAHANCRKAGTPWAIIKELAADLPVTIPKAGFDPKSGVKRILDRLQEESSNLIFTMDDLGHHVRESGPGLLDSVAEALEEDEGSSERAALVAIAHSRRLLDQAGSAARRLLGGNLLRLERYGGRELSDILRQRVEIAFKPGAVKEDSISLISDISSDRGDARFALELLETSGRIASDGEVEKLSPRHVRRAKAEIRPSVKKDDLAGLRERDLLVLLALSRRLRTSGAARLEPADVEDSYMVVCEERAAEKEGPEEVRASLDRMYNLGLIDLKPADETPPGQGCEIGISDPPCRAMEKEVVRLLRGREDRAF